ncbi:MAG: ABC transporter ATPase [Bacteroidota bacterium]
MNTLETLPLTSRVWIYQSNREFNADEAQQIEAQVKRFVLTWNSHSQQLPATGKLLHNRFIILMVDQDSVAASGCSIDSSVHFIQMLGKEYNTDFFDRMNFAYLHGQEIKTAHREEFQELYKQGIINDDTIVFNNLVDNKGDFERGWKVRLGDSWYKNMVD